jgi:cell volume regulation protein A
VTEISVWALVLLFVGGSVAVALTASKVAEWLPVPAPALFLVGAAAASDFVPGLGDVVSIRSVERLGVVALVFILFNGGMHIGLRRGRRAALPIVGLGLVGTFATAAALAVLAHLALGFAWPAAGLLGAALAPTDPAVVFSVLGRQEISGRSGTILEGESGANDPVGIALLLGLLAAERHGGTAVWPFVREFGLEMSVGAAVGIAGGYSLRRLLALPLPGEGLYPLRTLAAAIVIYGAAGAAHGSGFLAVFLAGLIVGDTPAPYKPEIKRFHGAVAQLAEIAVFVGLGLTIDLRLLVEHGVWLDGLVLALVLAFVVRPLVIGPLLYLYDLRRSDRIFIVWSGLKGAVPILLGTLAQLGGADDAGRIYRVIFVVVLFSVVVQGSLVPSVAHRLGVPMRTARPEPWSVSIRTRQEPRGVLRLVVRESARACGKAISDLPLAGRAWIALILRDGEPVDARAGQTLEPRDEVLVLADPADAQVLRRLFEGRTSSSRETRQPIADGLRGGAAAVRRLARLPVLDDEHGGGGDRT